MTTTLDGTLKSAYDDLAVRWRDSLQEAAALRKAMQDFLDGNYERPVGRRYRMDGQPSTNDHCIHHVAMYESCEACIEMHFEAALKA